MSGNNPDKPPETPIWGVDQLIEFFQHDASSVQLWALHRLEDLDMEREVEADDLDQILRQGRMCVIDTALELMVKNEINPPCSALQYCLDHEDLPPMVRHKALVLLASSGDQSAWNELFDRMLEGDPCDTRLWTQKDGDGFMEEVRKRWGDGPLPSNFELLAGIISLSPPDLAEAAVQAMEELSEDSVEYLLKSALWRADASFTFVPSKKEELDEIPPFSLPENLSPPFTDDSVRESAARILTLINEDDLEEAYQATLNTIAKIAESFNSPHSPPPEMEWGIELARGLRQTENLPLSARTRLGIAYGLFSSLYCAVGIEHAVAEHADLPTLLDGIEHTGGPQFQRVRDQIQSHWAETAHEPEAREEARKTIDAWLDSVGYTEICSALALTLSLQDYPVWERLFEVYETTSRSEQPELLDSVSELMIDTLAVEEELLRKKAEDLIHRNDDLRQIVLEAIPYHNRRWVGEFLLEHFDLFLNFDWHLWSALRDLGYTSALDRVREECKPGETNISRCLALLGRLDGSLADMPDHLRENAETAEEKYLARRDNMLSINSPDEIEKLFQDQEVALKARCTECGRLYTYQFDRIYVDPDYMENNLSVDEALVPDRIITCKNCGARGKCEIPDDQADRISMLMMRDIDKDDWSERSIIPDLPHLHDGTRVRDPLQAIEKSREKARSNPESGEAWRRLGTLCESFHEEEEAEKAWRKAVEVDEDEVEAAYNLAQQLWNPYK
ncbi:MAG: hypothetical protein ACOCTQ_01495, partial [Planctomycetota bacterium]